MFLIFNKDKILSYAVAICTVFILFSISFIFTPDVDTVTTNASNGGNLLPIYCVDTEENKVALTINCAWNANDIDQILETLKNEDVKVTFFMVGDWIEKYREAVEKINSEGHEIANHSYNHPHVNNLSYDKNIEQIQKCSEIVKNITGRPTTLYRGPYGEYNNTVIESAKNSKHIVIQWSIDTLDYQGLSAEQMWERIEPKLAKGSIILMHNGTETTALSLEKIIKNIKGKGYKIVPVSELIYKENYTIDANGVQHRNK